MNLDNLTDLFQRQEELDPELVPYLYESEHFGTCIQHPLVFSIPHASFMNAMINASLKAKKEALDRAYDEDDWHSYIWLHERPFRVDAFLEIVDLLSDEQYWELLGRIWIDSENIRQNPDVWQELLESDRPCRECIMDEDERKALEAMPSVIPVYQGHTRTRDDGWSWTTERKVAEWFAQRFALLEKDQPVLSHGVVSKRDVIAYFTDRNESEILVPRDKVRSLGVTSLKPNKMETNNERVS